jgi:hypothetical protein
MTLDPESARMARLYQDRQMSIRAVGAACSRPAKTVHRRLVAARIPRRAPGGGGQRRRPTRLTPDQEQQMAYEYLRDEVSLDSLGATYEVSADTVARKLRARGIQIRERGRTLSAPPRSEPSAELLRLHHSGMPPRDIAAQLGGTDAAEVARQLRGARLTPHRGRAIPSGAALAAARAEAGSVRALAKNLRVSEKRLRAALEAAEADSIAAQQAPGAALPPSPPDGGHCHPKTRPARAA